MTQQYPGFDDRIEVTSGEDRRRRLGDGRLRERIRDRVADKLKGVLTSDRVYATIAALLVQLFGERFGLSQDLALAVVQMLASWVIGDSIRPTDNPFVSRRFWVMVATIITTILAAYGIGLDPETVQNFVLGAAAWIIGDSWRETLHGQQKMQQKQALMMRRV